MCLCASVPAPTSRGWELQRALVNLGQTGTAVLATSDTDTNWPR